MMKNDKLNKVKKSIRNFCEEHATEIVTAASIGGMALVISLPVIATIIASKGADSTVNIDEALPEDSDFGTYMDDVMIYYEPSTLQATMERIREEGYPITENGLELLKTILDHHNILD